MEHWIGKVAVITGASSGIGAATAIELAMAGMIVIGLARRPTLIDSLNDQLQLSDSEKVGKIYSYACDVTKLDTIKEAFNWIDNKFGRIDVLVNAAGIARLNYLLDSSLNRNSDFELQNVINTNLMGSIYTTRAAYKIIQKNNNYGHIFLINSVLGHQIPSSDSVKGIGFLNTYPASKFGITGTAEVLQHELNSFRNKKVKITSISPGWVKTNILTAAGLPNAEEFFQITEHLQPKDIANSILFALGTPSNVLVEELTITPVGQ